MTVLYFFHKGPNVTRIQAICVTPAPLHMNNESFHLDLAMRDVFGGQMKKLLGSWRVDVAVRGKGICMSIVEMHVLTFDNER